MKKFLLAVIYVLSFACLNAQTYTSGHLSVTMTSIKSHDSTNCCSSDSVYYHITVDSSYAGETVNIVDTFSASLVGSYINTTGVTPWVFTTPPGGGSLAGCLSSPWDYFIVGGYAHFYAVVVKITAGPDTISAIAYTDSLLVTNPCLYNNITGTVYADNNGNCMFDGGDVGLSSLNMSLSETLSSPAGLGWNQGWGPGYTGGGAYYFGVQQSWMVNYTLSLPSYYAFIFPASPCFSGSYTFTTLPQTGVDFPLQCTSNIDVQCYALSPTSVRLHRAFFMQPYVSNTGCDTASGQLTFIKDSRVIYDAALSTYPADIVHGDTLIWNYSGLSNLSGGAYWNSFMSDIHLAPDTTVVVGDTLCFRAYTNIPAADINPANNDYTICLPVVYSYDPNVKEVSPAGSGPQGYLPGGTDSLTYNLHFQNTGSAIAENIRIIDTLDSHINAASLRILGTSHKMTPKWLTSHIVEFDFNNINLPDSFTNWAASQGEVRFSVALNMGLPVGTQIKNTGYIYFDANPPVVTNTTLSTITVPTKVDDLTPLAPKVYPNPATDYIMVENLKGGEIAILNMNGSVVLKQNMANNKTTIDVSKLPGGIYILKIVSDFNTSTTKFTKY